MAEDPKRPEAVPGTVQVRAGEVVGSPPTMPGGPPAMPGGPPPMPTASNIPTMPGGPPAMPTGPAPSDDAVMATMRGDAVPISAPPSMPPARYELAREIARGGMGRVIEATDTTLGRVIALKEALSVDKDSLKRFERETRITARLEHPSIVPLYDAGVGPNGAPYYVMRKISGKPLESFVGTAESVEDRLALVPHMVAAANAIAHAHERGIVHRDIKPSNILVGDLGEVIVIDWGLAKTMEEPDEVVGPMPVYVDPDDSLKTRAGIVYGTPGFMAPEQLRGKPVDARCDVYALGATLYHLLLRKPPHHAPTADAMMKAAVDAPPAPIRSLVPGVPAELGTIVDKALAHDAEKRYQTARELAEDLNRFLTGQLVASHHYTAAEKLRRFVKKHRVPVLAVSGALIALIIGGIVAYVRVSHARDRAVTAETVALAEKQKAVDENERLVLSQGWINATANPTLAIAMVKPLAEKRWREVRAIASAARASGVAWSLPSAATTTALQMSKDGALALATGDDGTVRLFDLGKRTAQVVFQQGGRFTARFADDDKQIAIWHDAQITLLDRTGKKRGEIATPTPIASFDSVGITGYWADTAGAVWSVDLAGGTPVKIPTNDYEIKRISASPDNRFLAFVAEHDVLLYDRTKPDEELSPVFVGRTVDLDWADDGSHLAGLGQEEIFSISMVPEPLLERKLMVGERYFVAYAKHGAYTIGPTGVSFVSRDDARPRRPIVGRAIAISEARGGSVVAATEESIVILSDTGDRTLAIPTGRIGALAASGNSPYVVAAIDGHLLVWNLDDVLPKVVAPVASSAKLVGDNAVIATFDDQPAQWIDLATGKHEDLPRWPAITAAASAPSGNLAAVVDMAHHAFVLAPDKAPQELPGDADELAFASDHELVLATSTGIVLYDTATSQRTVLASHDSPVVGLVVTHTKPVWVGALFKDLTLWRKRLDGGEAQIVKLSEAPPSSALFVAADGRVIYPAGTKLNVWQTDRSLAAFATLAKPITALGEITPPTGAQRIVAFSDEGDAWIVDPDDGAHPAPLLDDPLGHTTAWMSAETGMLVVLEHGALALIDPQIEHRKWTLASASNLSYTQPQLSTGGRRVLAQTSDNLLAWTLDLPEGPEATTAWLDQMTNAITGGGARSLGWR